MTAPHVRHLHGQYNHRKTAVSMAESEGIFDHLGEEASFGTDTPGIANDIAGLALYIQNNLNNPIMGVLPDIDRTGEESVSLDSDTPAKTFRATFNPPSVTGVAGGGQIPDGSTWDIRKVAADIQISTMAVESDVIMDIENRLGHDSVGFEELIELGREYMVNSVEKDALARTVNATGGTAGDTPQYSSDDLLVPLDRVIASEDEETNGVDANGDAFSDGDLDVYDIDRSDTGADGSNEANWADAQVDHNGGTLRQLTSDLMNTAIDNQVDNSTADYENLVIVTGRDSARVLSDLRESQFRADALREPGREDVGDAESRFGHNFTARISHWDGIPVVVAPTVPSDSLSRIYVLDPTPGQVPGSQEPLPKIGIENYRTPDFWRAGVDEAVNPLATGEIKNEAAFAMYHEVTARDLGAQGKIRDLEA